MTYSVGQVRKWNAEALAAAGDAVGARGAEAGEVRRFLSDGGDALAEGWEGHAADAVLDAVELEKAHVTKLAHGLEDLADALLRAQAALGPAVQTLRDRIADAEVGDSTVRPASGRNDIDQSLVDGHAEAISSAVDTVRSLDEHYGREIDEIAARLHQVIPPEADRPSVPGPDDPWPARGVDGMTGAMSHGNAAIAGELDPETRGKHKLNPVPDDFGRPASKGLRALGRFAGPLGSGLTVYDGMKAHAEGETSKDEAILETTGALGGGFVGGMAAGAAAGTLFGPVGTFVGAGIGAAVGTYLGQKAGDIAHDEMQNRRSEE